MEKVIKAIPNAVFPVVKQISGWDRFSVITSDLDKIAAVLALKVDRCLTFDEIALIIETIKLK